jgi:transcriptional regulator with XRE-family HTH domain
MPRPNGRDPQGNPAVFLGTKLRQGRIDAGYKTQDALAGKLGFDRSVVTKAETGERPPTDDVLAAWCDLCGLDMELFSGLVMLARTIDGPVPRWFEDWLQAEAEAYALRYWSPIIITPIFQTAAYARALLLAAQTDTSDATIDALVDAKLARQAILESPEPPEVVALIDELVLHRLIGSSEIMREQLIQVAKLSERPHICVQVVPDGVGATAGLSGEICLASGDGLDVLHTDATPEGHTTEARSQVRAAAVALERIRGRALPRDMSRDLILRTADERWKTQ